MAEDMKKVRDIRLRLTGLKFGMRIRRERRECQCCGYYRLRSEVKKG